MLSLLIQMSKLMLSRFKKSLGESSNIIYDSRMSNSIHRQLEVLEAFEKTPEEAKEYDKSSLSNTYRNSHDNNKLIKKIPQLISQNDELKLKVQKLEDQLQRMLENRRKNSTFSFKQEEPRFQEDNVKSSFVKRSSKIEKYSYPKTDKYSLDYRNRRDSHSQDRRYNKFYRQSVSNHQVDFLNQKISELEQQISNLNRINQDLQEENQRLHAQKERKAYEIDEIVAKFEQTLKQKEDLSKAKITIFEDKLGKLKKQHEACSAEKNSQIEQNNFLREQLKKKMQSVQQHRMASEYEHFSNISRMNVQTYRASQAIDHLWKVKEVQYNNLLHLLHSLHQN